MGKTSRALLFILLNIFVSVFATLTVLWLWERAHPRPEIAAQNLPSEAAQNPTGQDVTVETQPEAIPTPAFLNEDIQVSIRTIVGAGDLNVEYVEIVNQGQNPIDLSEWQLHNEDGNQFNFPTLILNSSGAIKVFSKTGTDTVIELYWQADAPIWESGETATLMNAAGEIITSYSIP